MADDVTLPPELSMEDSQDDNAWALNLPTLEQLLDSSQAAVPYSVALGLCDDGLPLMLDLTNPGPGAFLIAGDDGFANTIHLHTILASAYQINEPDEVNIHLISPYIYELTALQGQEHYRLSFEPTAPEAAIAVEELSNLAKARQRGQKLRPVHILAIDGLDMLWASLSTEAQLRFHWLLDNAAQAGIWMFATLESQYIKKSMSSLLDGFPSRIVGAVAYDRIGRYLAGADLPLAELSPGYEAYVRAGQTLIRVAIPESEELHVDFE